MDAEAVKYFTYPHHPRTMDPSKGRLNAGARCNPTHPRVVGVVYADIA